MPKAFTILVATPADAPTVERVVMKEFYHQATDCRVRLEQSFVDDMPVSYAVTRVTNDSQPLKRQFNTVLLVNCERNNYAVANAEFADIVRGML